jgi:hypothetical protein
MGKENDLPCELITMFVLTLRISTGRYCLQMQNISQYSMCHDIEPHGHDVTQRVATDACQDQQGQCRSRTAIFMINAGVVYNYSNVHNVFWSFSRYTS